MPKIKTKKALSLFLFIIVLAVSFFLLYGAIHILYCQAYPKKYQDSVGTYCRQYQVDENLVYAVIRSESRFNPNAVSSIGARGLMQITKETFDWAQSRMQENDGSSYEDILQPNVNIKYGVFILSLLLNEFSDQRTAIAAYHAGWGNVKQWLNNPQHSQDGEVVSHIPFPNTKAYVSQVMSSEQIYNRLYSK